MTRSKMHVRMCVCIVHLVRPQDARTDAPNPHSSIKMHDAYTQGNVHLDDQTSGPSVHLVPPGDPTLETT